MINSINPINNITTNPAFSAYGQAQNVAKQAAQNVFASLEKLSGAQDGSISVEDLQKIKAVIEEASATKSSAYGLVDTLIQKFGSLSSDGKRITQDDFLSTIKFSVAQGFAQETNLHQLLKPGGSSFAPSLVDKFGTSNLQVLDLVQLMDSLPSETVNKMIYNLSTAENNSGRAKQAVSNNKIRDDIQDYKTVTKEQLKFPINISV